MLPFHALQAGLLVHARVKARFENGLQLAFLGLFEGTVNMFHLDLPQDGQAADLAAKYPDNHRVRGGGGGRRVPAGPSIAPDVACTHSPFAEWTRRCGRGFCTLIRPPSK